jgi:predicted dehydrogenase
MRRAQRLLITAAPSGDPGSAERVAALRVVVGPGCDVAYRPADDSDSSERSWRPPPVAGYAAVLVDGAADGVDQSWLEDLLRAIEGGTCALVLAAPAARRAGSPAARNAWSHVLGVGDAVARPFGEWFAKPAFGAGPVVRRLPDEFAVCDRLVTFDPAGDSQTILTVSVGFSDRPVVLERRLGAGRLVVAGLGNETSALAHPEIGRLFRRALVPAASLAAGDRPLGLGILGYGPFGGMGRYHGLAARAISGLELVAVCDRDAGRRKAAEEEFGGIRSYAGPADLCADEDAEVVVVATPPDSHVRLALALLRAGRHVVLEKPMCFTRKEADTLINVAEECGRSLTVHQSRRWDPDFLTVLRSVERGDLGEVFNVETFVGGFEHPCREWHSEASISGGAVYDWGSHHLDWILLLMGAFPVTLTATGHKRVWHDTTNLDQVRVRMGFEDGREAEFLQSDVAAFRRPKFHVQGTSGTIVGNYRPMVFERVEPGLGYVGERAHHAEAPAELNLARYEPGYGLTESKMASASPEPFGFHRNLADHLLLGEPLAVTPESVRKVVALLEAAQQSTDGGNVPVGLPRFDAERTPWH